MKKPDHFQTTQQMLEWQYFQILSDLQEIQRHDGDETCPCRLSEDLGENCLAKHSLGLSGIAIETAAMETDKKNAALLYELGADAKDRHMKIRGFLCHQEDAPEFTDWSRQWRKKIEPLYYQKSCKVKLRDDEAPLEDTAVTPQTKALKSLANEITTEYPEVKGIPRDINRRADTIDRIVEELMARPTATPPAPRAAPSPAPAAPTCPINYTFAMGITTPTKYEFTWNLSEAAKLIVSHDPFTFQVNPKFVAALQPRLRDRAATQEQVMRIAANLAPDLLLQDFLSLEKGAPIVDSSNLVLCGNGRVMGIMRAVKDHPARYSDYRARLMEIAAKFLFDAAQVDKMRAPVLVRVLTTPVNKKAFAEECNASTVIEASPIEKAKTDAEKITPAMLNSLLVLENESIFDAIKAMRNKEFVVAFLNKLPPNEQAGMVDAKGVLSQPGTRRIAMAIFVATFKGDVGIRLAEKFFESTDPDVLNVFSGITRSLAVLARAEAMVAAGERQADYAFGDDLAKTVEVYSAIKQNPGMTVAKYIAQQQMEIKII